MATRGPKRLTSYRYGQGDNLSNLAQQYQTTPQEILAANPGGYPFSLGQTISIPQYNAFGGVGNTPYGPSRSNQYGGIGTTPYGPDRGVTGVPPVGYGPAQQKAVQPLTGSFLSGSGQNLGTYMNENIVPLNTAPTALPNSTGSTLPGTQNAFTPEEQEQASSDYMNTRAAQFYAANNVPFERQLRWDPKKKKYITVGQWMRQSQKKFNKKGKYVGDKKKKQQQEQKEQDFTLANSIINFSASAG